MIGRDPADDLPPAQRVTLGKQRAGAAITLLRRGTREEIFGILRVRDDPESLTQFVHRCRQREVQPPELLECLNEADQLRQTMTGQQRELEDRVLFGLLLALGEFTLEELPADDQQPLIDRLAGWHASDPSSAIHSATGWLLRHWGQNEITQKVDRTPVPYSPDRQWYTLEIKAKTQEVLENGGSELTSYMTFVVVPAGEYEIGSPPEEPERAGDETRHKVRITRPFAILDREVTWADAALFNPQMAMGMKQAVQQQAGFAPESDHPWVIPTWYEAVLFCRWLTAQVGLGEEDQAYANPETLDKAKYPPDPNPQARGFPKNWPLAGLDRQGFRLPTEAEWEAACRAGTQSAWSYGGDVGLLDRYAWFVDNSGKQTHTGRMQRPNLRGVFDMHGNVYEWCHDWYDDYSSSLVEDPRGSESGSYRVNRGGSWDYTAGNCRSSNRFRIDPSLRSNILGFRLAAVPPSPGTGEPEAGSGASSGSR